MFKPQVLDQFLESKEISKMGDQFKNPCSSVGSHHSLKAEELGDYGTYFLPNDEAEGSGGYGPTTND